MVLAHCTVIARYPELDDRVDVISFIFPAGMPIPLFALKAEIYVAYKACRPDVEDRITAAENAYAAVAKKYDALWHYDACDECPIDFD